MDERVDCMACLAAGDADIPGVVIDADGGITHALTTVGSGTRRYRACDFDDAGVLLPAAYYGRLVELEQVR
jgi:hypothetical protein